MSYAGVAITGAAETPYRRRATGIDTTTLLADAFARVIADAGIGAKDVDGLAVSSFTLAPDHAIDMAWRLGLTLRWCMQDTLGGASGLTMLNHAARAIQAGDATTIVLLAGDYFGADDFATLVDTYNATTRDHLAPLNFGGPNALFALLTQRHAARHGLLRADYGAVCIAQRAWAAANPLAVYRTPLTPELYLADPMVADPLCRFDCVPVVSGADAVVLTRGTGGVRIRALHSLFNPDHQSGDGLSTHLPPPWEAAGLGPQDVDLLSVYDDYPVMVLVQLADLGFCTDGDLHRLIHHRIASRTLRTNTSGGQLSAGQAGAAGGLHGLVEVVRQLRGSQGARQIDGARIGLVAGYGMVQYRYGMCANVCVLEA